ncbi:MAG TPA: ABC transporter substrate-binding protein [Ferruginibacter sp.]|nr:ABC transporter substrate-binding protein [Ferruginibacter sp.]
MLKVFVCGVLCSVLWAGCARKYSEHHRSVFRYNETSGIASLDPAFARNQSAMWAVHQLYNTLTEVDHQLQIVPSLATSWEISDSGRTWLFHLRTDVYFHNDKVFPEGKGRRLVANDVVYSFQRLINPETASPGAWIFNTRVAAEQPFTAVNDSIFRLRLNEPFPPVLGVLSMKYCSIVPLEAVSHYGAAFRQHPVGTGPFRMVRWKEGQALILEKNPGYFERDEQGNRLPYLDGIKITFLENKASEFVMFRQGQLDFVNDIDPTFKDEILTRGGQLKSRWNDQIKLHTGPYLNVEYLGILNDTTKKSPLQQPAVRKALQYGIPREKLLMYLRNSIGKPAQQGFIPSGFSESSRFMEGYTYQPDSARAWLKRSGYNGEEILLTTVPQYEAIGSFIAGSLQEIGLKVRLEQVPKSVLLQRTSKSEIQFFRGSWIADYPDEENFLSVFYSKNPAPPNYTRYSNPQYDQWYEMALRETDATNRQKYYRLMDSCIVADIPVIPLWYDMVIHLVQPEVTGFQTNPLNMLELRRARKK